MFGQVDFKIEYYQRYEMTIKIGEIDSSQRHCNYKYVCAY